MTTPSRRDCRDTQEERDARVEEMLERAKRSKERSDTLLSRAKVQKNPLKKRRK